MKKIKQILIILVIACFVPCFVEALSGSPKIVCENVTLAKGQTTTCKIGANLSEGIIKGYSGILSATGDIEIISSSLADGWFGTPSTTNIDAVTDQDFSGNITVATITIKMKDNATTGGSLTLSRLTVSYQDESNDFKDESLGTTSLNLNVYIPKTTNDLTSLTVTNCELNPAFSSSITSYTCPDTENASVTVKATHNGANISGANKINLKYGANTIKIVVTAETGATKTYSIAINRIDNRDATTTLSELTISNTDFIFDPEIETYDLTVPSSVKNISINAKATAATSKIEGLGDFSLTDGLNTFKINVTAQNSKTRTYTINITKSALGNIPSTILTKLTYNGKTIKLLNNTYIYTIGVDSDVNKIDLGYQTNSSTTTYKIEGSQELESGFQTIKIIVSDSKEPTRTYNLIIYKAPQGLQTFRSLENVTSLTSSIIINSNKYQDQIISKEIFNLLKNSRSTITYNVVNEYDGIIYSLNLNKNANYEDTLNLFLVKSSDDPLTYTTNIPANIDVTLYLENETLNNKQLYLYNYNKEKNTYTLINDKLENKNQYIKFTTDGSTEYIISETIIKNEIKSSNKALILCTIFFVTGFLIAYISIIILKKMYKNKQKRKKEEEIELPALCETKADDKKNQVEETKENVPDVTSQNQVNDNLIETLDLNEAFNEEHLPTIKENLDDTVFLPNLELLEELNNEKDSLK